MLINKENQATGEHGQMGVSRQILLEPNICGDQWISDVLNGKPYELYRKSVSLETRRARGAFFTAPNLADRTVSGLINETGFVTPIIDPCVGMGDLLLAYARRLPTESSLEQTLVSWGEKLHGVDISADLVGTTRLRLAALAHTRHGSSSLLANISEAFPNIKVGDFFDIREMFREFPTVLLNPPFQQEVAKDRQSWGSGRVSMAAVFVDELLEHSHPEVTIMAILPEVLRCGSRYARFRAHVESLGFGGTYSSHGRFDQHADVDVFSTIITRCSNMRTWASVSAADNRTCVGDKFDVRVGPVVPHRSKNKGPWRKYICAKTVPLRAHSYVPTKSKRFQGTVFQPPFVVIRRTSGPSDPQRASPTVILGDNPIAVENHLMVLLPRELKNALYTCNTAVDQLKSKETQDFLNRVMRCRHLTKPAVQQIPWVRDV